MTPSIILDARGPGNRVGHDNSCRNGFQGVGIGDQVTLQITGPCPRCVMTTLAQADLPADPRILRTAARQNQAHVGVYASVVQTGLIRRGDSVRLAP